jgi:hypothetical protein
MAQMRFDVEVSVRMTGGRAEVSVAGSGTAAAVRNATAKETAKAVMNATNQALEAALRQVVDKQPPRQVQPANQPA